MISDISRDWVHITYAESIQSQFRETYGFASSQNVVHLEGVIYRPATPTNTLFLMMHPSGTLHLLPLPSGLAESGCSVMCMASRYPKNDTALIMEKVVLDLGACVRHAKEVLGYKTVILLGWSGGGSLALFYQSQAQNPSITHTPAGDPVDLVSARLMPVDGIVLESAHKSRARTLCDWIDPSVLDESDPDKLDRSLDLYSTDSPVNPPYPKDWLETYRAAQLARVRRITERVQETLHMLRQRGGNEMERGFVTHRTMADPRFLDGSIEPNDRRIGWSYQGDPSIANTAPAGVARFSTLRSWLSQWSIDHSRADGPACAPHVTVPMLAIEHSADDAVPQSDTTVMYKACGSQDKEFHCIVGANHYLQGQPEHLAQAIGLIKGWAEKHGW